MTTALARACIALVSLVLVAGCAAPRSTAGGPGLVDAGRDCDTEANPYTNPPARTPLPADAVLASATRCLLDYQSVPGDGEWLIGMDQKATDGLDALAAALRLPSEEASAACPAILYKQIAISVTDTKGRHFHPQVPHDACGAPLKAATDAIEAVPWTTLRTTKIQQSRSELAITSECADFWKPVIPMTAHGGGTRVVTVNTAGRPLRVCRFDLEPDPANVNGDKSTLLRSGQLAGTSTMDTAAGGEFLKAVASAPPATGTCVQVEAPFAVVRPVDGSGPWITVERGGCSRTLVDGEDYLRQLDAALIARLIG